MNRHLLKGLLPPTLRLLLAPSYRGVAHLVQRLDDRLYGAGLTEARFVRLLQELGITPGATVFLHSSMDAILRCTPSMTPIHFIKTIQGIMGEKGTLLMPTFPFRGRQIEYMRTAPPFDPRRTPSRMGLVTELFRRMPGVQRSLHPTHSVAAWGRLARDLLEEHTQGGTFAATSPFGKLVECQGLEVGIGVQEESFAADYVAVERHLPSKQQVFADTPFPMTVITEHGELPYPLQGKIAVNHKEDLTRIMEIMLREGLLQHRVVKGLRCASTPMDRYVRRYITLLEGGLRPFRLPTPPPAPAEGGTPETP